MSSIRVLVRHGEAVVRPDQPELWVQGEKISPGQEKSFDISVEEPLMLEAQLTEEMQERALELEEADGRVAEENELVMEEKGRVEEERQAKRDWTTEQAKARKEGREPDKSKEYKKTEWDAKREEADWKKEQKLAEREKREPDKAKEPKAKESKEEPKAQGFASSPAPKVEPPKTSGQATSGMDSREVKGESMSQR